MLYFLNIFLLCLHMLMIFFPLLLVDILTNPSLVHLVADRRKVIIIAGISVTYNIFLFVILFICDENLIPKQGKPRNKFLAQGPISNNSRKTQGMLTIIYYCLEVGMKNTHYEDKALIYRPITHLSLP